LDKKRGRRHNRSVSYQIHLGSILRIINLQS
jgi:hypothetical protein